MENLYRALNHTRAINLIHYVWYYERWIPLFRCCSKDRHNILDKIWALRLGKLEFQFDPTLITCNVIQAIYMLHLQQWNLKFKKSDSGHQPYLSNHLTRHLCIRQRRRSVQPPPHPHKLTTHSDWVSLGFVFINLDCIICNMWRCIKNPPNPKNSTAPRHNSGIEKHVNLSSLSFIRISQFFHSHAQPTFGRD